jgi:hypothetical protein
MKLEQAEGHGAAQLFKIKMSDYSSQHQERLLQNLSCCHGTNEIKTDTSSFFCQLMKLKLSPRGNIDNLH